ncbi:MAG: glycoside hydrolase family 15 protein [Casimicrobiaceae bacterium]
MPLPIEDYAVIGNCETLALVGRDGSIDWLGLPRFDSAACFAALLGDPGNGRWLIAPADTATTSTRRYRPGTLILETTFDTPQGTVCVTDCMSRRDGVSDIVRVVRCIRGKVTMHTEIVVRFDYGATIPWVSRGKDGRLNFVAGPDRLVLDTTVDLRGEDLRTVGDFELRKGEQATFALSWSLSFRAIPDSLDPVAAIGAVQQFWKQWASSFKPAGEWSSVVLRSALTLKALSHWETGGIVAAATTSLPEQPQGSRNWDYRYCWLRDATFTLLALVGSGFLGEAMAWRNWLLRAVAGSPDKLRIMYGIAGERRLEEYEVPWLAGYEGAQPVRIGNGAAGQLQLDVYGEVLDALYAGRRAGMPEDPLSWSLECALIADLEKLWDQPDNGMWESRAARKHYTHSKVMAWVAFDRAVRSSEEFGLDAPVERWRGVRDRIHADVCHNGFDAQQDSFVQAYGFTSLDASLLLIPLVGFLPADDPRVRSTLAAIERRHLVDGLVMRYDSGGENAGKPPREAAFVACSFWLVDNYVMQGRFDEAGSLFARLLALCNDVGLIAEEYLPSAKRQMGNFPQAFSHLALINSARNLTAAHGPARQRAEGTSQTAASADDNSHKPPG